MNTTNEGSELDTIIEMLAGAPVTRVVAIDNGGTLMRELPVPQIQPARLSGPAGTQGGE